MRYHLLSLEDREDLGESSRPRRKKHDYRIALFGGSQPQSCRYFNPKVPDITNKQILGVKTVSSLNVVLTLVQYPSVELSLALHHFQPNCSCLVEQWGEVRTIEIIFVWSDSLVFCAGLQLDRYTLPLWEATGCHSCLLGQCGLHPGGLTALPHQAHGLLQRLEGQLVLKAGSAHTSGQPGGLRLPGQDLHIRRVRSWWAQGGGRVNVWIGILPLWVRYDWPDDPWMEERPPTSESYLCMCSCRQLCPRPLRMLWHENRVMADENQYADGPLQPRLSGGQWAHLCLWRNGGQQRVGQNPQQLRGLRPQHTTVRDTNIQLRTSQRMMY